MVVLATYISKCLQKSSLLVISAHHSVENNVRPLLELMTAGIMVPSGTATNPGACRALAGFLVVCDCAGVAEAVAV